MIIRYRTTKYVVAKNIHIDGKITLRVVQKPIKTNTNKEKQVFICKAPLFLLVFFVFVGF